MLLQAGPGAAGNTGIHHVALFMVENGTTPAGIADIALTGGTVGLLLCRC
jgi:hypothetical protein